MTRFKKVNYANFIVSLLSFNPCKCYCAFNIAYQTPAA